MKLPDLILPTELRELTRLPRVLLGSRAPEDPIRAELFSIERLEQHAESLAAAQRVTLKKTRGRKLLPRVKDNGRVLTRGYRSIAQAIREERTITPAATWLIDNFHVVEEQIREIIDDLPPNFYHELPKLAEGHLQGYPRVFGVAWAFVAHTDSRFDPDWLRRFVRAYQKVHPLQIGEIWALAISLRIILVENMRRITDLIVTSMNDRQEADALADALLGLKGQEALDPAAMLSSYKGGDHLSTAFAVHLVQRLRDQEGRVAPAVRWLDQRLSAQRTNAEEIVHQEHQDQTSHNTTVRNIITSMRLLSAMDWAQYFEDVAVVDEILRSGSDFAAMDFPTRDLYRHAIEELSRGSGLPEVDVAQRAIERAKAARLMASDLPALEVSRQSDPGYFLISRGRALFEKDLKVRVPLRRRFLRLYIAWATPSYLGSLALFTGGILAFPLAISSLTGMSPWAFGALALFGLIPASDVAIALVNRFVMDSLQPRRLPKLDFPAGIPDDLKTLVVMPVLLTHRAAIDEYVERLEIHYLSNSEGHLQFALLTDWTDAPGEHQPDDDALLRDARAGIAALNARYPWTGPERTARFFIFHRRRLWNAHEGVWMGWERKRGKLHEFNLLLRRNKKTTYLNADAVPADIRYVITLDSDTRLPRGAAYRMVGAMAHPLNRPRFDAKQGRVTEGYGIMQPRVTPTLPTVGYGSLYERIYSGPAGIDPYAFAVSDVYQDLFREGSFIGKGIYDVDAFESAMNQRVPENTMLSHDLFEGLYARTALLTDIELFEEFPSHYQVGVARSQRWVRGDWQLLPFILRSRLPVIHRWKMIDNLRRSLSVPSMILTLLCVWAIRPAPLAAWMGWIIGVIALPYVLPVLIGFLPRGRQISMTNHLRGVWADFQLAVVQTLFAIVFMAHQAWVMTTAIVQTLYRLLISRGHLLEWTSMAQAKDGHEDTLNASYRRMTACLFLAVGALLAALWAGARPWGWTVFPFALAWILSPWVAQRISLSIPEAALNPLSPEDRQYLLDIARQTWTFFETFVTAEHHHLPPDNFQEIPHPIAAHRTSPTNIGLYLLSITAARDFGWISTEETLCRFEITLETMKTLQRHKGHLFNWYDTHDLRPLEPLYISTVDSGNLAGHLWAVSNACRKLARVPAGLSDVTPPLARRLEAVAAECDAIVTDMQFGFLCDPVKKIFSIGFQMAEQKLDPGYYDLLASEARLASFVAIAKGDVPALHWFHLSRSLRPLDHGIALLSWSGSMFEYLMPSLVMRAPIGSLLDQTCRHVVRRQMSYGQERGIPWGVSESGYNAQDLEFTYQYSNFGVPGLGLKRGLSEDLISAPYATALAAMVDPAAAVANFKTLTKAGAQGRYGFYEALDYTPTRLPEDQKVAVVRQYMAHHQGMTLTALANVLQDGILRDHFHSAPQVQATELLLQERTPRDVPVARLPTEDVQGEVRTLAPIVLRRFHSPHDVAPRTHLLSNSRYSVMVTTAGSGYSRWKDLAVTRWREDSTRDGWGTYFFLRDVLTGDVWSAGYQPTGAEPDSYEVDFSEDRAEIVRKDGSITTTLEVIVSPEDDAEIRRVTLKNMGELARDIEITSYAEMVMATPAADQAHPAFSNLFVQTEFVPEVNGLICARRPRSPENPPLWAAHVVVVEGQSVGEIQYESDRARFLGRGRTIRSPRSVMDGTPLSNTAGAVLDPIMSLRRHVHLDPGETARVTFTTAMASSLEEVMGLADKYHDPAMFERSLTLAWTHAHIQQHHLGIEPSEAHLFQDIASRILYAQSGLRPPTETLELNERGAQALWAYGISGDIPIVLVRIDEEDDREIIREILRAHEYWRMKNLAVDLVILNERGASYVSELQNMLEDLVRTNQEILKKEAHATHGDIFVLRTDRLPPQDRILLLTAARVVFLSRQGTLAQQMERIE